MEKEKLLKLVAPEWHQDFLKFVESGEASEEFVYYLYRDKQCQKAVGMVFEEQSRRLERMANELNGPLTNDKLGSVDFWLLLGVFLVVVAGALIVKLYGG